MTIERDIETYFKSEVKKRGGLPMKFTSPSYSAVPDQIVIHNGQTYFCEIKAPNKKPRSNQVLRHKQFKEHGIIVHVIDTKEKVDDFVKNHLQQQTTKHQSNKPSKSTFTLLESDE